MTKSIMAQLPNDIIMDIIKIATHEANVDYWKSLYKGRLCGIDLIKHNYLEDINLIGERIMCAEPGYPDRDFDENTNIYTEDGVAYRNLIGDGPDYPQDQWGIVEWIANGAGESGPWFYQRKPRPSCHLCCVW
jgi:hypothetical protein